MTTVTTARLSELHGALGDDGVVTDPDVTVSYARDQAKVFRASAR